VTEEWSHVEPGILWSGREWDFPSLHEMYVGYVRLDLILVVHGKDLSRKQLARGSAPGLETTAESVSDDAL
jgi:hypothetical protein